MGSLQGWALIAAFVIAGLNMLGLLDWLKPKSAVDAAAELDIAEKSSLRLQVALDAAVARVKVLEQQRTNEPVLAVLAEISRQLAETAKAQQLSAEQQVQVIDRLARHNGSFAHMEQSLAIVVEGLKALMGTIADLHDIPLKGTP